MLRTGAVQIIQDGPLYLLAPTGALYVMVLLYMIHKVYDDDVVYDEDNVDGDCCFANLSKNDLIGQLM